MAASRRCTRKSTAACFTFAATTTHEAAVQAHGIQPIDLVVVNLYPFEQTVAKPDVSLHDAIENIDIGGPSMLRSAAKNHDSVTVMVDPADYAEVAKQISESGNTTLELRRKLAAKVFARTAAYDGAIAAHLQKEFADGTGTRCLPALSISAPLAQPLRYGENPHQTAALYGKFQRIFPAAPRQGTFLQQHSGPDGGGGSDRRISKTTRRRWRFSSTRIPAASARARACARPGTRRSPPTTRRRSAASSRSTNRSTARARRRSRKFSAKSSSRRNFRRRRWRFCRRRKICGC